MENAVAHRLRLSGVVQGVGMRPWLYRLAQECGLTGWVSNDGHGVELLLCGPASAIAACRQRLDEEAPPPASIDGITELPPPPPPWPTDFRILPTPSATGGQRTQRTISPPDLAPCPDCLADFSAPANRRWRHPFLSCSQCGPRYTVVRALPYDRCRTSLADFPLCPACAAEYTDPADRRFHAEPLCCPACGPQLWLRDRQGHLLTGEPLPTVLSCLQTGGIVALKGVGGWQLLCDARNPVAVATLRQRKGRDAKPFALLAANLASLAGVVTVDTAAGDLLTTAARPIVLLPSVTDALTGVAPGLDRLGVMLPASPLHYLLFHEAAGQPSGSAWLTAPQELLLVATSANLSGEPLLIDDQQALAELPASADLLLGHDRPIVTRCDDSLLLPPDPAHPQPTFIRRARGYTPLGIRLPLLADRPPTAPVILAVGGHFKNTVCVLRGDTAYLAQHLGDLDNAAACRAFEASTRHLLQLLEVTPAVIAHDLHPDFHSSRFAATLAAELDVPTVAVPHHQAHLAAVLAEHGLSRGYGLALDGIGLGPDGGLWGGELLHLDADGSCQRLGHLRPLPLPGSDRAAREPWRLAAAALHLLGQGDEIPQRFADQPAAATVAQMLERQLNCPPSSSLGRLFDAAAGLLGVSPVQQYEAQAAMQLEALARRCPDAPPLAAGWRLNDGQLDFLPLLAWLAEAPRDDLPHAAATFHATLAAGLAAWVEATVPAAAPLAIGGGCTLNRTLTAALQRHLSAKGRPLLSARQAPPNDGGIALGQAILAAAAR